MRLAATKSINEVSEVISTEEMEQVRRAIVVTVLCSVASWDWTEIRYAV